MFKNLFICGVLCLAPLHAADYWNADSDDTSPWSLAIYSNKSSGVIGGFTDSNKGVQIISDSGSSTEGVAGNEMGFLRYTLGGNKNMSIYNQGLITINYLDLPSDSETLSFLPQVVFLEGTDRNGSAMILACSLPINTTVGAPVEINLIASNFQIVTNFYYKSKSGPSPGPAYTLSYTTSGTLDDEDFSLFLDTTQSFLLRNYHSVSESMNLGVGGEVAPVPYTLVSSIDVQSLFIPEPATASLSLLGLFAVMSVRRRSVCNHLPNYSRRG